MQKKGWQLKMFPRSLSILMVLSLLAGSVHAGLQQLDDGIQTKQIVADGQNLYILKDSGQVWHHRYGQFQRLDDGQSTRMLAAGDGKLFLLKDSGRVFQHLGSGRWRMVDDGQNSRMIATARGRLFLLKDSGHIWCFHRDRWSQLDDGLGTRQIDAVGDDLWILKENGNVWKYSTTLRRFDKIDDGSHTRAIAGTSFGVAILKESGELWSYKHGRFDRVAADPRFTSITSDSGNLYALSDGGMVRRFDLDWGGDSRVQTPPRGQVKQVAAAEGTVYLLLQRGNIWTETNSPWAPQAAVASKFRKLHAED